MGKPNKQIKGYYFSLKTQMPTENGCNDSFRILGEDDMKSLLDEIRTTQLNDRFRKDFILVLKGDSIRGDGVVIPEYNGYTPALFMRRRISDLPKTARQDENGLTVNRIMIGADSFVMETTYVLIHNETATVLFLVNGNVSSYCNTFASYLGNFLQGEGTRYMESIPIVNVDCLRRMDNLNRIMKIEFSYRGTLDAGDDENRSRGMGGLLGSLHRISNDQDTGTIRITMSAKKNKSLKKADTKEFYTGLVGNDFNRKSTSLFRVRGNGASGIETIDFINNEFLFTMSSDVSARNIEPVETLNKMHSHFESNLRYIKDSIGAEHSIL